MCRSRELLHPMSLTTRSGTDFSMEQNRKETQTIMTKNKPNPAEVNDALGKAFASLNATILQNIAPLMDVSTGFTTALQDSLSSITAPYIFPNANGISVAITPQLEKFAAQIDYIFVEKVQRFVDVSDVSPSQKKQIIKHFHTLRNAHRAKNRVSGQLPKSSLPRLRRDGRSRMCMNRESSYWASKDTIVLTRRVDCLQILALAELPVATAFFGAYDAFGRRKIDYRRHTLASVRTVIDELIKATGQGISTEVLQKLLVKEQVKEKWYHHKKTKKIILNRAVALFHIYSDPQLGEKTAKKLNAFRSELNELHKPQIKITDEELATLLQKMEEFICDLFACWYSLGQVKQSRMNT
jgi:hypothetical protein